MKRFLAVTTLALTLMSTAAFADTRGDYISNPEMYGAISVNKGLPNGRVVSFDIPVHSKLLAPAGAMAVGANGRIYATSIGYLARPIASLNKPLGMTMSPYTHESAYK